MKNSIRGYSIKQLIMTWKGPYTLVHLECEDRFEEVSGHSVSVIWLQESLSNWKLPGPLSPQVSTVFRCEVGHCVRRTFTHPGV